MAAAAKLRNGGGDVNKQTVGEMTKQDLCKIISECLKPVQQTVNSLKSEVEALGSKVESLTLELSKKDQQIEELKVRLEESEQYARRNNLRIFGVPETPDESVEARVLALGNQLNTGITGFHIDRAHRVGKRVGDKPRPIIVKFIGYSFRRDMFIAKKKLKGSGVTIREDLTIQRLHVLRKASESYSEKNVWTRDGVIIVKVGDNQHRVKTDRDLENLMKKHPPQQ